MKGINATLQCSKRLSAWRSVSDMLRIACFGSAVSLLAGCQPTASIKSDKESVSLATVYDYQLYDNQRQQWTTLPDLVEQLKTADVIVIGELHGSHAAHLLQMQLLHQLHLERLDITLSMEMFNRDQQTILNQYLDGEIGEATLIKKAPAWSNYKASYRPLIEYAKTHFIPVTASNAPSHTVRCIGRQGSAYLEQLEPEERMQIAKDPFLDNEGYRTKYMDFLSKALSRTEQEKENSYLAQLTRDNTMAESLALQQQQNPNALFIHLNGSFHSDEGLGTVALLKARAPDLKIVVISPIEIEPEEKIVISDAHRKQGDFTYYLHAQPIQYVSAESRHNAHSKMFKHAKQKICKGDPENNEE